MRFLFLGTTRFSVITLQNLVESGYTPELIVTMEPKLGNRRKLQPVPLQIYAEEHKIPFTYDLNRVLDFKTCVLAAYGKYVPARLVDAPDLFINVHPSNLPCLRGASPLQTCILQGNATTAASIILMHRNIDAGHILSQTPVEVNNQTFLELEATTAKVSAGAVVSIFENGYSTTPQDESQATFTRKITKADAKLDFQQPVQNLFNQIRAYEAWPIAWCHDSSMKRIKIHRADIRVERHNYEPGRVIQINGGFKIACCGGFLIPTVLQYQDRKKIPVKEFINGFRQIMLS